MFSDLSRLKLAESCFCATFRKFVLASSGAVDASDNLCTMINFGAENNNGVVISKIFN